MKLKIIYAFIALMVLGLGFKVVSNMNKKRGLNKDASERFIKNFSKIVGADTKTAKEEENEDPDEEMKAMIDASGEVSDFAIQMGDEKLECDFGYRQENLKKLKVRTKKLGYKCRDGECSVEQSQELKTLKNEILDCIDQNELGDYE